MKTLICSCCGADITAPQFHNGKAYGYTCITKVSKQKRVKDAGYWVMADSVEFVPDSPTVKRGKLVAMVKGIEFSCVSYDGVSSANINGGMVKLSNTLNGNSPVYSDSAIFIKTEGGKVSEVWYRYYTPKAFRIV